MRRAALGVIAIAACFSGDSAQGLPCTADEFCAGLKCVDGYCGGPPDGIEPTSDTPTSTVDPTATTTTLDPTSTTIDPTSSTLPTSDPTTESTAESSTESTGVPETCDAMCWDGCFGLADQGTFDSAFMPVDLEVTDLNGDTLPDLFLVSDAGMKETSLLERRVGVEKGWFAGGDPLNRALASRPTGTVAGDIDGELQGDAVVAYFSTNEVSVFLWDDLVDNYSAVGGAPMNITGSGPIDPVIFDLDGRAPLDVAVATNAGFEVFTGITPDTANHAVFSNGYFIDDMVTARVGGVDLLMVALHGDEEVTTYRLYEGDSDATEIAYVSIANPTHIAVGDFDADGNDDDVVVAADNGTIWLSTDLLELGPEPGGAPLKADEAQLIGTFVGAPRGLAVGQLDGVCGDDAALITHTGMPDPGDDDVIVLRNDGEALVDPIGLAHYGTYVVKLADLDGDGLDEIVVGGGVGDVRIVRYMP